MSKRNKMRSRTPVVRTDSSRSEDPAAEAAISTVPDSAECAVHAATPPVDDSFPADTGSDSRDPLLVEPEHVESPPAAPREDDPLRRLEAQLHEKDVLIHALTERLEQAAEQLDRVRRTGLEHAGEGSPSPAPQQDQQHELIDDLRQAVQQWQDLQADLAFGRIETQLSELRDLIAGQLLSPAASPSNSAPASPTPSLSDVLSRLGHSSGSATFDSAAPGDSHRAKRSLLDFDEEPSADSDERERAVEFEPPPLPEPPAPVDLSEIDDESLRLAIEERDRYIERLTEHLHLLRETPNPPIDLTPFAELPEEQREYLEAWTAQFQAKHRHTEVELSLERARLARDELALRHQRAIVENEMRRLGLKRNQSGDRDDEDEAPDIAESKANRRWLGLFGGRKSAENSESSSR